MRRAYLELHRLGHAHSVEVWQDGRLVGGLYGVRVGAMFYGESMFSRERDASKVAMAHLVDRTREWGVRLIDCQLPTPHLESLGATLLPRVEFLQHVAELAAPPPADRTRSPAGTAPGR
jgi:leucyl/phenylalanyl-tRNA--protein transferase